jgi:L-amino acid N-acyltransferase YncA
VIRTLPAERGLSAGIDGLALLMRCGQIHRRCDTFRIIGMSDTARMSERRLLIIALEPNDWSEVRAIYLEGIATGYSTFETAAPEWDAGDRSHLRQCRLVAHWNQEIVGWAALTPVSGRYAYAGVAEVSVYVAARARREGVGLALLTALIGASEQAGVWTLQGGIFPENTWSLAMCRKAGFALSERGSGSGV